MILKSKNTFLNRFVSQDIFWEPNSVTTPKMFCYNSSEGFEKKGGNFPLRKEKKDISPIQIPIIHLNLFKPFH